MAGTAGMATVAAERRGPATPLRLSKPDLVGPGTLLVYKHQKLAKFEQAYTYTIYTERKQMKGYCICTSHKLNNIAWLIDGPVLTSRPIQDMSSARPEIHLGLAPTNGSKSWQNVQVHAHIYVKRQLTKCHAKDLKNSRKDKTTQGEIS
jgi:hypothetical protein